MAATLALTQVEFDEADFPKAQAIAAALGYEQTAYTSSSSLWGLFCMPENPAHAAPGQRTDGGCVIKTAELGFLFVQDGEDVRLGNDWADVVVITYTRSDYLREHREQVSATGSGAAAYRRYYGQFVTSAVIETVVRNIGAAALVASTDEHLNDIPLPLWDAMAPARVLADGYRDRIRKPKPAVVEIPVDARRLREANGSAGVSLSDYVCIAKEAARQWLEAHAAATYTRRELLAEDAATGDRRYYAQFVTPETTSHVVAFLGADRILAAAADLADVPVSLWDTVAASVPFDTVRLAKVSGGSYRASLSDRGHIAKEAARQWRAARDEATARLYYQDAKP